MLTCYANPSGYWDWMRLLLAIATEIVVGKHVPPSMLDMDMSLDEHEYKGWIRCTDICYPM